MKSYIIKEDSSKEEFKPENGEDFTLERMQEAVGGLIQIVDLHDGRIMIVNEEGELLNKELNVLATNIFISVYGNVDFIVGDVIICPKSMVK